MKVKELIKILEKLENQDAVIDMASDEEGNSFGDISEELAEGKLKNGKLAYSLYPESQEMPEERYEITNEEDNF